MERRTGRRKKGRKERLTKGRIEVRKGRWREELAEGRKEGRKDRQKEG